MLPISCTLYKFQNLPHAMSFTARSLKTGSGIKTIFDKSFALPQHPTSIDCGSIHLLLNSEHADYEQFIAEASAANASTLARPGADRTRSIAMLKVQDSMETDSALDGDFGIIESWALCYQHALRGESVVVDLSRLRPAGSTKDDGYKVTSSGPACFARIYIAIDTFVHEPTLLRLLQLLGTLNAVILKGGHKRGIVTSMMHTACPLIDEYLAVPTAELDGSHKKGVIMDSASALSNTAGAISLRKRICAAVNSESIFLQKCSSELGAGYEGTFSNVCVGIFLPDRGTCLIWRVNLGLVETMQQLVDAYELATRQVVALHVEWHQSCPEHLRELWQPIENDCQVAIDPVGLANMLKRFGYTYEQFVEELAMANDGFVNTNSVAYWFTEAYKRSTEVAQELAAEAGLPPFVRLHTVEPAQRHAFELQDYEGATLCRGIWPPFDQVVNRVSDVEAAVTVDHGNVETVADVGAETVFELNSQWQTLMQQSGLPHAISADIYEPVDEAWLAKWWDSPQLTAYYFFASSVDQSYARKQVEELDLSGVEPRECLPCKAKAETYLLRRPADGEACSVCAE